MAGDVKDVLLLDVTPLSLGIETLGGVFTKIIERNTTIPTKKSQVFSTAEDNQSAVDIHVLQGEREFADGNITLGRFRLDEIPPARRGMPQIEVTFDIDSNGIVHVTAKDLGTGKENKITITSSTNLSEDEINKKVQEAKMHEEEDKKKKERVEAVNHAENTIYQTEKSLTDLADKVTEGEKSAVEGAIEDLKKLKDDPSSTAKEIRDGIEKLMKSFEPISQKLYEQAQSAQNAQNAGEAPQDAPSQDDGVVDADYTEVKDDDNK